MTPEFKGRNILQQTFDVSNELGEKFQVVDLTRNLKLYKSTSEPIPNLEPRIGSNLVFGFINNNVAFMRERKQIEEDKKTSFLRIDWIISAEGTPPQTIVYCNGWDDKQELWLGFLDIHLSMGRGGSYSLRDGSFQKVDNQWNHLLLETDVDRLFKLRPLSIVESRRENFVHIEGWDNGKLVEEIVLPEKIDLEEWLPKFSDTKDKAINDPDLSWEKWFKELEIEYHCSRPIPNQQKIIE
ncbi:MAG: hypothetical protein HW400_36 [Candidatus Levybacteria bacterium]|nr:hypothetical protein [Candidatus Levybacteria bacterium]